jgi:glycosyltransferase involved in cell wall biosynthesis
MNILLAITGLTLGGAEKQTVALADAFVGRGHQVMLVALGGTPQVLPSNPQVLVENLSLASNPCSFFRAWTAARKLLRTFSPDVVHTHLFHANIFFRLLRLVTPITCLVNTIHSSQESSRFRVLLYRLTAKIPTLVTGVSSAASRAWEASGAAPGDSVVSIPNGIDLGPLRFSVDARLTRRSALDVSDRDRVFLALGRITPAKDYPTLLRAYAQVLTYHPNTWLWILGDGDPNLRDYLTSIVQKRGVSTKVRFLGLQTDVVSYLSAADFYVLSSQWEGFGLALAEAMVLGLPCVVTRCGGPEEVAADLGFYCHPGNPESLAKAMTKVLTLGDKEINLLAIQGKNRIQSLYSLEKVVTQWLTRYESLLP